MFFKIGVLKYLVILREKHLCWDLFLINFVKKRLQHRYFPVNIEKILEQLFHRTPPVAIFVIAQQFPFTFKKGHFVKVKPSSEKLEKTLRGVTCISFIRFAQLIPSNSK